MFLRERKEGEKVVAIWMDVSIKMFFGWVFWWFCFVFLDRENRGLYIGNREAAK